MARTGSRVVLNLTGADNMKHVEPGDAIAHLRSFQGGIETSMLRGKVSTAYTVIEPLAGVDPNFYRWVFKSSAFISTLAAGVQSLRDGQSIKFADFATIDLPRPPIEEQRRVADFLDDRVSRIDRIITARREQASLVALQATAGIQEIFDASAKRYGLIRLGYILRRMEQGWSPQADAQPADDHEWGVMRSGCVNSGYFQAADNKRLPPNLDPVVKYEIRGGDLLMSRASGSLDLIGSVAVVPGEVRKRLLLCDKLYRLTPEPNWSSEFLAPMLRSRGNRDRIRLGVSGAEGMANNLPSGVIRDLRVPAAPLAGQVEVVERARGLTQKTESIQSDISRSIDLIAEYKTSLITAAVTGELDVTTAGSNIPG